MPAPLQSQVWFVTLHPWPRPFMRLARFSHTLCGEAPQKTSRVQTVAFALLCYVARGKTGKRVVVSSPDRAP